MTLAGFNYPYNIIHVHIAHHDCMAFAFWMLFHYRIMTSDLSSCVFVCIVCACVMSVCVILIPTQTPGYDGEVGDNPFSLLTLVIIQHQYH